MSDPGGRPGPRRVVAGLAAPLALVLVSGLVAAGLGALPPTDAGASTTSTTIQPWVPGVNGTLKVGIDRAPSGCNPNSASGNTWADRFVLAPVLPSAFVVNGNGQAVYDPATITQAELQSTNPQTVVYTINPKAVWSDGAPLTAQDFVATWRLERGATGPVGPPVTRTTPKGGSGAASASGSALTVAATTTAETPAAPPTGTTTPSILPGATGITGPSMGYRQIASITPANHGRSFTVVFMRPYADWQSLFDDLLPARVLRRDGWNPTCTTVDPAVDLSAGPFVIHKVVPKHEVVLVRNPRWWEQPPNLSRLVIKFASGPAQLARWLDKGVVDVALPAGFDQHFLESVTSKASLLSESQPSTTFLQVEFSTTSTLTAPLAMRNALAHAIDRRSVVNKLVGWADTMIVPAASHLYSQSQSGYPGHKPPPLQVSGQPGYTPGSAAKSRTSTPFPATADLAATAHLMSDMGYAKGPSGAWESVTGTTVALRLAVDDGDSWAKRAGAEIARQLGAAGFAITVVGASSAQAAGEALSSGAADMALLPMHSSPYPSQAIAWYTPLLGPAGQNGSEDWSGFDDPTVDTLLEKAAEELNPVDAAPLYTEVDAVLWKDMVALPLCAQPSVLAWSGRTAGVSANLIGPSLLWSAQSWSLRVPPTSPNAQS